MLHRLLLLLGSMGLVLTRMSGCAESHYLKQRLQISNGEDISIWDSVDPIPNDFDARQNCTNEYCLPEDEYIDHLKQSMYPESHEWILIGMHVIVFVAGLVGNALVCIAVYRNHQMRTVTNYFIVNLAVADLLVIVICLPPTVVWDITQTWFLGLLPCKIVLYFQTVSVTVSVLTLTFISVDRWYAICFPLRFKSTTSRAKTAIIVIWVIALLFDIPDLLVLHTFTKHNSDTVAYTQCGPKGLSARTLKALTITKFVVLYVLPLVFISFAYYQIVRVLWRNEIPGHNLSTRIINANELSSQANFGNPEGQLKSRRKAAKMLVAVVLMFAICCLPVHLFNILWVMTGLDSSTFWKVMSCLVHWLFYANSAINPLIYNFMSGKFRREFKRTFCCPRVPGSTQLHHLGHNVGHYRLAASAGRSSRSPPSARPTSSRFILIRQSSVNKSSV